MVTEVYGCEWVEEEALVAVCVGKNKMGEGSVARRSRSDRLTVMRRDGEGIGCKDAAKRATTLSHTTGPHPTAPPE